MRFVLLFLLLSVPLFAEEKAIDIGMQLYTAGEKAEKPEERKKAFNAALFYYVHQQDAGKSGELFYDIGNCYYQLGEYGSAVLYYYRALEFLPREEKIYTNLSIAAKKLGFEEEKPAAFPLFYLQFSLFERSLALVASMLIAFAFFSCNLWSPHRVFLRLARLGACGVGLFAITLLWSAFLAPIYAVVISPTPLYQGPGVNYARISKGPLSPGTKVEVVEVVANGGWMSVKLSSGERGYLSTQQAQAI